MNDLQEALRRYTVATKGTVTAGPLRLVSTVHAPASQDEVTSSWSGRVVCPEASQLWLATRTARLFEDIDYGQWGLHLLDPATSRRRTEVELDARPTDFRTDDVVIGEFLGDQELLVVAPSEASTRRILVALPLDGRADWYGAAAGLSSFLDGYFDAMGRKFWEGGS